MYGKKPPAPLAKEHAWTSLVICLTWTRKNFVPLLGIEPHFFGNLNGAQTYAELSGHNKI